MPARVVKPADVCQIKVTLRDSHPPIWRGIQVRSDITLARLHRILQCVMGWEDAHLHLFVIRGQRYGLPDEGDISSRQTQDERNYKLGEVVANVPGRFAYEYDFGDNWQHILEIERLFAIEEGIHYPRCLAGARACPPEDVGGIPGYKEFLEAIKDPKHPEHEDYLGWIGNNFDPEAFDIDVINRRLRALQ